jgi:16S rRNA (cytidine1402-2'-O)-methyltransferase
MASSSGRLYVVATPIGNLEDLSPRALATLREVAAIYCEDTRVTGKLASRFSIRTPRFSCHAHNEQKRIAEVLERLAAGQDVALVSDAGTPAVSDPGRQIVRAAAGAGFRVLAVAGPSALSAALSISGLPAVPHVFLGFAPAKAAERRKLLEAYRERPETLVFFEGPHRLAACLRDCAELLGPRPAVLAREMTKLHEEVLRGTLQEIAAEISKRPKILGECVVIVGGSGRPAPPEGAADWQEEAERLSATGLKRREVARVLAKRTGIPSREIYRRLAGGRAEKS